ncbi:helix-turn-helix domain-containing protein [Sphingomonas sp. DC1100-1]|uniref:helix-turn-helix domain-containing protein n=1 Tax=unclassified Sphingomonas TaxID=196159 RepID=UPI003CF95B16
MSESGRFASLTEAERQILALLAAGHTAKTAAAALGLSVHGVNERLREARRKTGAGSSRDLARALAAQENCDAKIGVAPAAAVPPEAVPDLPQRAAGTTRKGVRPMVLGLGIAAAAVLLGGIGWQQERGQAADPLLGSLVVDKPHDAAALHARVRREARDAGWAAPAETRLMNRFGRIDGVNSLRVLCATDLCEVAGRIAPGGTANAALLEVQQVGLSGVRRLGFTDESSFSVGGDDTGQGAAFVTYLYRRAADVPYVVTTTPAMHATIPPGPFTLGVTFDRPMQPGDFSFVKSDRGAYPECDGTPRRSADGRSFTMQCTAVAGQAYAVGFNSAHYRNFKSLDAVPAEPSLLTFDAKR